MNHFASLIFNLSQDSIYDAFVEKAAKRATERIAVTGDPFDPKTQQGSQVSEEQFNVIMKYIDIGKKEARLVAGGARIGAPGSGHFIEPTIFADVKSGMQVHDEEIFGPVLSVIKFSDVNDAIFKGNEK